MIRTSENQVNGQYFPDWLDYCDSRSVWLLSGNRQPAAGAAREQGEAMSGFKHQLSKDGKTLDIKVDLTGDEGLSKSGKTKVVASSRGNISIGDVKLGLNVYRPIT